MPIRGWGGLRNDPGFFKSAMSFYLAGIYPWIFRARRSQQDSESTCFMLHLAKGERRWFIWFAASACSSEVAIMFPICIKYKNTKET